MQQFARVLFPYILWLIFFYPIAIDSTTITTTTMTIGTYLCAPEGRVQMMTNGSSPQFCSTDIDCLPPAICHGKQKICCFLPLNQEAPPIGCPKGTRQLRNAAAEWLSCLPNRPDSCPGGALCYEDSLEQGKFRCCGKDPSDGCGAGQRVLRHANDGSNQFCTPGDGSECAGNAICQWSFAFDRFQCCEPDNGCPPTEVPLFDYNNSNEVLMCDSEPCPEGAFCHFNFWIAASQCCTNTGGTGEKPLLPDQTKKPKRVKEGGQKERKGSIRNESTNEREERQQQKRDCPPGEIIYSSLSAELASNDECKSDVDCPAMAHCHRSNRLCCGPPGECPRPAEHPIFDELGHIQTCSVSEPELCPSESKCRETNDPFTGVPTGQRVCCASIQFQCAASGIPFPNEENPLRCDLQNPITCPMDMLCQSSNVPQISICCTPFPLVRATPDSARHNPNLCPHGWIPIGKLNIFCHPTIRESCPDRSACILSPIRNEFVCCQTQAAANPLLLQQRNPTQSQSHLLHNTTTTTTQNTRHLRRSMLSCPNKDDLMDVTKQGYPIQCTMDRRVPCRKDFICQPSLENPQISVCCSIRRHPNNMGANRYHTPSTSTLLASSPIQTEMAAATPPIYRCPTALQIPVIREGQNVFCDLPGRNCPSGSTCQSALNSFAMMICCRDARQTQPMCPDGMQPEESPVGFVLCELFEPNQCTNGFKCVHAKNDPEQTICCARIRNQRPVAANQYICPNQQVIYRDGPGPRFCSPNVQSACPVGFSCEEAVGQPGVFVCCSLPAQPICPAGFDASLHYGTGNPIYCSPPADVSMCPAEARCMPAENRASTFLCCVSREPGRICPQPGHHALLQPNGQPEQCSGPGASCSKPAYTCQLSYTFNNRYVCCGPPGWSTALCADGRETYQQELGRTLQCNPLTLYTECPNGYECALSNVPNTNVCCRRMEAPRPTPQEPTDGVDAQPPITTGTFRPPVEELSCPVGWSAYQDQKGAHHFCQDALDMTCPHGFSCAQSSVNGIFMCCRLASSIQCPQAYSTLMVNNNPRLCSIAARQTTATSPTTVSNTRTNALSNLATTMNTCPAGYSCMQSSVPAVYVCCGTSTVFPTGSGSAIGGGPRTGGLYCSDGQIPAYLGAYVRFCSDLGQTSQCPPSYVCSLSNRAGFYVCCHPFPVSQRRRSPSSSAITLLAANDDVGSEIKKNGEVNMPTNIALAANQNRTSSLTSTLMIDSHYGKSE